MTVRQLLLALVASLLVGLTLISEAVAHVAAEKSNPEDGSVLTESPSELSIQYSDLAKLISLQLSGSNGGVTKVDISAAKSVDGLVSVQLPPLQPDNYEVSWRVLSIDGHPVAGSFTFTIETPESP